MHYLEKIRFLKEKNDYYFAIRDLTQDKDRITINISPEENQWEPGEIDTLKEEYPFLPSPYIDFIREYDTLGLAWFTFFGSKKANIRPIKDEIEDFKEQMRGEFFPFGKYPDGSIFVFNRKGEVLLFDKYDYDWENPKFIADNFERFINDCVLGKRYPEFAFTEENKFYKFLQAQGWA